MSSCKITISSFARSGQKLRAVATLTTLAGVAIANATITVKMANASGGTFRDFITDAQGNVTVDAPANWSLTPGPYDVKICAVTSPGNTWDNTQGTVRRAVTL